MPANAETRDYCVRFTTWISGVELVIIATGLD